MAALWLPLIVLVASFVVNVGHWFVHKRHLQLQVDAAALAGGGKFGACFNSGGGDAAIFDEATKYSGVKQASWQTNLYPPVPYSPPLPYNAQIGGSAKGAVSVLYQSLAYAGQPPPPPPGDGTETDGPCETPSLMLDVKATESNLPWFLRAAFVSAINAHARVQLRAVSSASPKMPLAVPDINPKQVAVTFVNEANSAELTGCTGLNLVNTTTCTFSLTKGAAANGLNIWTGPANVTLPSAPANIGVRVGMGGTIGSCANTPGTNAYRCFDASVDSRGLYLIRDYSLAGPQPSVGGVWPTSCSNSQFFSEKQIVSPATTCAAGVAAKVNFGTGATIPDTSKYQLTATVGGQTRNLTPLAGSYDIARDEWLWETTSSAFSLAPGTGVATIDLTSTIKNGTPPLCPDTGPPRKDCTKTFANIHRFYSAGLNASGDPLDTSGPVRLVSVTDSSGEAASLEAGSHAFTVTIGLTGNYEVHTPCPPPPSGKSYNCPTDPTVPLRLKVGGSSSYSVDCGGVGTGANLLAYEIENGCTNSFSLNSAGICPDVGPAPTPPDCAPVNSVGVGTKTGPVGRAMNNRFAPGGTCLPNNYPTVDPTNDARVVILIVTDFSAFGNGAGSTVPVISFGAFYVTGWDNSDAVPSCDSQNDLPPGGTSSVGEIWGHFISYVLVGGTGGSAICEPGGLLPCTPVLTQ